MKITQRFHELKLVIFVGYNFSSVIIIRRLKLFVGSNFRHIGERRKIMVLAGVRAIFKGKKILIVQKINFPLSSELRSRIIQKRPVLSTLSKQ